MRKIIELNIFAADIVETVYYIWQQWFKQKSPLFIFFALCLNAIIAPAVYAATGGKFEPRHTYALSALGLVILGLAIYLFDVVFRPERY